MDTNYFIELFKLWDYSIYLLLSVFAIRYALKKFTKQIIRFVQEHYSNEYAESILTAFDAPLQLFLFILGIYIFLLACPYQIISTHPSLDKIMRTNIIFALIWGLYNLADAGHGLLIKILKRTGLNIDLPLANIISTLVHIIIAALGFVMIAKEWSYDISAFVASLGIGSLAVALAAKDALANVFGGIVIVLEKPFTVGDWIKTNNIEGTVETITFRSTCIRTFFQELVYVPNSMLSTSSITNFTKRKKQRIDYKFGLTYDTTSEQMQRVVADIKEYCLNSDEISSEGLAVNFYEFADSALVIRIVCYAITSEMPVYLDIRERFNLELMKIVERNGVSCAFPSQSLYIEKPLEVTLKKEPEAEKEK